MPPGHLALGPGRTVELPCLYRKYDQKFNYYDTPTHADVVKIGHGHQICKYVLHFTFKFAYWQNFNVLLYEEKYPASHDECGEVISTSWLY